MLCAKMWRNRDAATGAGAGRGKDAHSEQWTLPKAQKCRHRAPEKDMVIASESPDSFEMS